MPLPAYDTLNLGGFLKTLDQMKSPWACKDLNSIFIYANDAYANITGYHSAEDVIGKTDYDAPSKTSSCANQFRSQDKLVIQQNFSMQILDVHPYVGDQWGVYIFNKNPLLGANGEIIGTILNGIDITNSLFIEIGQLLLASNIRNNKNRQNSYVLGSSPHSEIKLSNREQECLFFFLRGKTAKQIGVILGVSHRTVESYLEMLRIKFNCKNRCELLDAAIEVGMLEVIPKTIFNYQLSIASKSY